MATSIRRPSGAGAIIGAADLSWARPTDGRACSLHLLGMLSTELAQLMSLASFGTIDETRRIC